MLMDAPLDQAGSPAMYVVAQNQNARAARNNFPNKLGMCSEYRANDTHSVMPIFDAKEYFLRYKKGPAVVAKENNNLQIRTETEIEVAKQPRHGRLSLFKPEATGSDLSKYDYHYTPDKDYVGLDNFEFLVSVDGKSLKVYYQVKVFPEDMNPNYIGYCNWEKYNWKISQSDLDSSNQDYITWLQSAQIDAMHEVFGPMALSDSGETLTFNPEIWTC